MFMRANILTTTIFKALFVSAVLLVAANSVFGASESELRQKAAELEKDINSGKKDLKKATGQVNTLQGRVDQLAEEISDIQVQIDKTNSSIDKTEKNLVKTESELRRQEEIMGESLKSLYKHGNVSTIELLASSKSFTEFINGQEYLSRVKVAVHESAAKVAELRDELKDKRADLEELVELQKGQRKIVASKKDEQDELLEKAKDKQFSYKKYVAKKNKEQQLNEQAIAAEVRKRTQGGFTSQGWINSNAVLGYVGSTGNSTGAHLHLSVYNSSGVAVDPLIDGPNRQLISGFNWPTHPSYPLTGYFGTWEQWRKDMGLGPHSGIDIGAPQGAPVRAIGSGDIICAKWNCAIGGGYSVIIRHSNGMESHYYHMSSLN